MGVRALSIVVAVAVASGALAFSADSASAVELCAVEEAACAEANTYGEATAIEASASETVFATSLGNVACESSTIAGETLAEVAKPLPMVINSFTFAKCKLGGKSSCTVEPKGLPYYDDLAATSEGNGHLTVPSEAEATLIIALSCPSIGLSCTYGTPSIVLDFTGGKTAEIVAAKELLEHETGGAPCPPIASYSGKYKVAAPAPAWVEAATTKLCKVPPQGAGVECPAGQVYSGGIKAYLPGANEAKVVSLSGPGGTVSCTEAPIVGSFGAMGSGAGEITSFNLKAGGGNCPSTLNGTPTVAVSFDHLPANRSTFLYRPGGGADGILQASSQRNLKLKMVPTGSGTECVYLLVYRTWRVFNPPLAPPIPMSISASAWSGTRAEGLTTVCPATIEIQGTWYVETAGSENLWIARN